MSMSSETKVNNGETNRTDVARSDDCDQETGTAKRRGVCGRIRDFFAPLDAATGVDGGWAWLCLLGCTIMHFLVGGYERSYGLIYLQLQRRFTSSATMAAWVGGTCTAMRFAGSPIATSLSSFYSARLVVFIGGVIIGGASIANSFATSVVYMFVSYGLVAGTGGSLVYSPGLVVIGQRFNKRRGLATGVATAGAGAGAFAFPPLMNYLFSDYGFMIGMLVLGALMFGNCISALLYRPAPGQSQQKPPARLEPDRENSSNDAQDIRLSDIQPEGDTTSPAYAISGRQVDAAPTEEKPKRNWKQIFITLEKSLGFPMWKKPVFVLFALSQGLGLMSYPTVLMLLPALATEGGVSDVKAALLLSLIAIVNTVSCLLSGVIFSIPFVRKRAPLFFTLATLLTALGTFTWSLTKTYDYMIANAVFFGIFSGIVIAQRTNVLCHLLGVEKLSSSLGMTVFIQGVGMFTGPLAAGALRDYTGTYIMSYVFLGCCTSMSALFLLTTVILQARSRQSLIINS